ncbi:MAG: hypothetical protein LBT53_00710 [Puniceicoccales bacterium]|nr:hypothetical protein [Puniceicoccales bacterium]
MNADFSPAANAIKIRSEKHANAAVRDAIARAGGTPEEVAAAKWLGDFQIKEGYIRPMAERVVAQRVGWRRFLPTANSRHACFCAVKAFFRENPEAQKKSRTNYSPPPKP